MIEGSSRFLSFFFCCLNTFDYYIGEDGRYYFQAGAICVGGFWRMQDKIGLPLDEIHTNGNVPQCELLTLFLGHGRVFSDAYTLSMI